jgi:hypothetical protein
MAMGFGIKQLIKIINKLLAIKHLMPKGLVHLHYSVLG